MKKRELICGVLFFVVMLDVFGLTGEADIGDICLRQYIVSAVIDLVIMGFLLLIGDGVLFPEKKEAAPDGNQDSGTRQ